MERRFPQILCLSDQKVQLYHSPGSDLGAIGCWSVINGCCFSAGWGSTFTHLLGYNVVCGPCRPRLSRSLIICGIYDFEYRPCYEVALNRLRSWQFLGGGFLRISCLSHNYCLAKNFPLFWFFFFAFICFFVQGASQSCKIFNSVRTIYCSRLRSEIQLYLSRM